MGIAVPHGGLGLKYLKYPLSNQGGLSFSFTFGWL
jgi:hypothetical protein